MASESSSAVLELNDADTDDTEPPSVTEEREPPPLVMQSPYDIAVKVDSPMKQLSTLETFVTYRVRCVCARWPPTPPVRRRYNHFKLLHKRLSAANTWIAVPPPPPLHTARQQLDRYSPSFVAIRTKALNVFLDRIVKHPIFTHSDDLKMFLTMPDEEFEKMFKSENNALNLWGFSSALYGNNETKPNTNGARVKDPEWEAHLEYLQSVEQKLITLCTLITKLFKGTSAVCGELVNLQRVCSSWSCQAGGQTSKALSALATGAGGAAAVGTLAGMPRSIDHRALLPLLAAYTAATANKVKQRQQAHAAFVAEGNPSGEMHNKLEQASEALRAELADWVPKTRQDVNALLIAVAERQAAHHARTLAEWERAEQLLLSEDLSTIFPTVTRSAVTLMNENTLSDEENGDDTADTDNVDTDNVDTDNADNDTEDNDNGGNSNGGKGNGGNGNGGKGNGSKGKVDTFFPIIL